MMDKFIKYFRKFENWLILTVGKVHWKYSDGMADTELDNIRELISNNYYIILTRRKNHLSTFFVGLANFLLAGKWGYWSHALLNLENRVKKDEDFRLVEATGTGVHYSDFKDVFDVHSVVLLKPKSMSAEYWTNVMDMALDSLGKPYDTLFDLKNDNSLSCVELVRNALMSEPNYKNDFLDFEEMIYKRKNLSPQMFYDCKDFVVVYEKRN
jgi:hypothetical protein